MKPKITRIAIKPKEDALRKIQEVKNLLRIKTSLPRDVQTELNGLEIEVIKTENKSNCDHQNCPLYQRFDGKVACSRCGEVARLIWDE